MMTPYEKLFSDVSNIEALAILLSRTKTKKEFINTLGGKKFNLTEFNKKVTDENFLIIRDIFVKTMNELVFAKQLELAILESEMQPTGLL